MLNRNSIIVLAYLKNYFKQNKKPVTIFDLNIENLSLAEIEKAFEELSQNKFIKLNNQYIYLYVKKVGQYSFKHSAKQTSRFKTIPPPLLAEGKESI